MGRLYKSQTCAAGPSPVQSCTYVHRARLLFARNEENDLAWRCSCKARGRHPVCRFWQHCRWSGRVDVWKYQAEVDEMCMHRAQTLLIEVVFQNFIDVGIEAFYQGVAFAARASTCTPRPAPIQPRTRSPLTGCASGTRSRRTRSIGCRATCTRSSSDSRWSRAGGTRAVALQAARRTQWVAQAAQSAHLLAEARETERVLRVEVALLREPRRRSTCGGCD